MRGHARHRWTAGGATLLPFLGVWLGHTAEYWRLHGTAGLGGAMAGSLHGYMLPAGIVLSLLAAAAGLRCSQAWWALGLRLRIARDAVARAWRGAALPAPPPVEATGGEPATFASLLLWLAPLQLALYVLQENLESLRVGVTAPGLGAISGVHRAAPLVHLAVAACIAAVALLLQRALRRRGRAVVACQRLARVLIAALLRAQPSPRPRSRCVASPRDRWVLQLLRRPPPALAS
jgi:hypothetical protein